MSGLAALLLAERWQHIKVPLALATRPRPHAHLAAEHAVKKLISCGFVNEALPTLRLRAHIRQFAV